MIQPNSRNARLAEFLTRDADGKYQLDVDSESVDAAKTEGWVTWSSRTNLWAG